MMRKFSFILLLSTAFHIAGFSQVSSVGKIVSYKKTAWGIEGKTASAYFNVYANSDNIIRVRVSTKPITDNFSYALASINLPAFKNFSIAEKGNSLQIITGAITAEIEKQPSFRVVFRNKNGEVTKCFSQSNKAFAGL